MSVELWGTFPVSDHLLRRAFLAEVILYDRLFTCILPEGEDETSWPESRNIAKQRIEQRQSLRDGIIRAMTELVCRHMI